MTKSQEFIFLNRKKLLFGRDFFNPDTSFMPVEDFEKSKVKILIVFSTPSAVKAVSTTKEALNDYIITHCPNTFIDFAFVPDGADMKIYDKFNMPYAIGLVTHLDASHFDIVGFSISVLNEAITMASIINSFSRCDKPIPLTWTERKDMKLGECPIIYCGGITAACGDIMYGELGDGRQAFSDFTYLGECGKTDVLIRRLIEAKETGKVTRSKEDRVYHGSKDDDIEYESLCENVITNQDFIDTLFDCRWIYQPQAYEVKFNDKTQIVSNKKINPKAQDWVKPLYPHELESDLGIGRSIIAASGENTGTAQIQVSEGLYLKGTLIRTDKGLRRIEDATSLPYLYKADTNVTDLSVDTTDGVYSVYHAYSHGIRKARKFITSLGFTISLSDEHPVEQKHLGSTVWKPAGDFVVSDTFLIKAGTSLFGTEYISSSALKKYVKELIAFDMKLSTKVFSLQKGNMIDFLNLYLECTRVHNKSYSLIMDEQTSIEIQQLLLMCGYLYKRINTVNGYELHYVDYFPEETIINDYITRIIPVSDYGFDLSVSTVEKLIASGISVHNCSAGGSCSFAQVASTRILTNKGIITLKDAYEQGVELVQAISPEKLEGINYCGEHDVYRVTLKSGHYNEGDENHKYMVFQDGELIETKAKDLIPGQVVFRRVGTDFVYDYQVDKHGNVFTEDKAKLLGFMHGDGHFRIFEGGKQEWFIYTKSGEEEYQELFKSLLNSNDPWIAHESGENTVFGQSKTFKISKYFDADLATVTCYFNYIPDVVFNSPESVKKAYIRGLFDADGWSNHKGIGVTTISEKFAQDVALLLQSIGYDAHVTYNGYFERNKVKGHRPSWMVTIPIAYMSKFRIEIGFAYKDCSERKAANWCSTSLPRTNNLVDCMRKAWVKRDYCREEGLSNCYQYVSAHNKNIGVNLLRKFKELHPDIQLPNFYEQVAKGILVPDEIKCVEFTGERAEMYDVVNTETHLCSYGAVLTHQCAEGNYCLPAGTLVKSTEGLKKIEDFKVGDRVVLKDWNYLVQDTVTVGYKPTISFELDNHQELKVANTHLILTIEDGKLLYKRAYELHDGDLVAYERSESFGNKDLSDIAYTVGVNLSHDASNTKRVLEEFFESTKYTVIRLLRGMFDTDGSVRADSKGRFTCSYTTVSKGLKDDVVCLLSMFGIEATVSKSNNGWEISISGNENIRRFKQIGFTLSDKQSILQSAVCEDDVNIQTFSKEEFEPTLGLEFHQIIGIFQGPEEMMYDINVEGSHAYSVCGWVSHNTGGWTEKSRERILWEARETKKYNAAFKFKPYSFNACPACMIIPTGNGKFNFFGDLKTNSGLLTLFGNESNVNRTAPSTHTELFKIKLSRGLDARMSLHHKQLVLRETGIEYVEACDLKVGDWIPQNIGYYKQYASPAQYDKYYFLGLWFGDGSRINKEWTDCSQLIRADELELKRVCDESGMFKCMNQNVKHSVLTYIYKPEFTVFAKTIFPNYKYGHNNLLSLTIPQLISFTKGWFDADGCGRQPKVTFKLESMDVARVVGILLNSIGINFHLSKKIKVTLNGSDCYRRDLVISGLRSRQLFDKYIGFTQNKPFKTEKTVWSDKDKTLPGIFGKLVYSDLKKIGREKGHNLSKFFHGIKGLTEERFEALLGGIDCYSVNLFHKGVRFSQIQSIEIEEGNFPCYDVEEPITNTFLTEFGATHNCNYVTDYKGMLGEFIKLYPKVTFLNMRMEELGRDADAIKMMKLIGSNRISAPIEGLSPRIQNNLLNKCLSTESFDAFMYELIHSKMAELKCGGIFTSYEEDEDFQWICDMFDKFNKIAANEGGKFNARLKCCLTADALTPVPGYGLLRQTELAEGPVCGYEDSVITAVKPQGMCEIYKLITEDGAVIKGTPEHPVLVNPEHPELHTSYKFIKDLKKGDVIYGRLGTEAYGTQSLEEPLAKIVGWYLGDGYVNKQGNFKTFGAVFGSDETELYNEIWNALETIGKKPKVHNHPNQNTKALRVHNAEFARWMVANFGRTSHGMKIDPLFKFDRKTIVTILRYWFAADGTVTKDGITTRIQLVSVNEQILRDLKVILANMGIGTSVRLHKVNRNSELFYHYTLEVRRPWVQKFAEEIGIAGVKQSKIIWRERKSNKACVNGFYKMVVESVEQVPDEETYGFTIDNGTYVTNGIVSHNTPLVHYNLTPMEFLERKSAKNSMLGKRWLSDEWYEKFKKSRVFFKVNGFRYSTFIEQCIIDLGRLATKLVYDEIIKKDIMVYSLRSVATDGFIQGLKDLINPDYFFEDRDPEHYISLSHRIHIDLMGSYIPRARRLVRLKKEGRIFDNPMDIRCLKTHDEAKTMCYSKCIVKDPLKIYADVEMDEEGNLHGDYRLLIGCERCNTTEQKLKRLKRPTPFTKTSEDLIAIKRIAKVEKIRFVIKRNEYYDVLNPSNTAYTFVAKLLQQNDTLVDKYYGIENHSMNWQNDPVLPYMFSGYQIVDVLWRDYAYDEVMSLIDNVNKQLKTTQIISAKKIALAEKLDCCDYNIFRFKTSLPLSLFTESIPNYKGEVKVHGDFGDDIVKDSCLQAPVVAQSKSVIGYFSLPMKYNPFLYLQQVLNAKKVNIGTLIEKVELQAVMQVSETKMFSCKNDNSPGLIVLNTNNNFPLCRKCLCKALLSKDLKNG